MFKLLLRRNDGGHYKLLLFEHIYMYNHRNNNNNNNNNIYFKWNHNHKSFVIMWTVRSSENLTFFFVNRKKNMCVSSTFRRLQPEMFLHKYIFLKRRSLLHGQNLFYFKSNDLWKTINIWQKVNFTLKPF